MGTNHSKKSFTQWDLIEYSNITGIPLSTVEQIYQDFLTSTGNKNEMDKKQFRDLYKQMYLNRQLTGNVCSTFLTDEDLNKMSDHVFQIYDFEQTGKLTFEEFAELYLMLNHQRGTFHDGRTSDHHLNYILNQYHPSSDDFTKEDRQQIFNRLHKYQNCLNWKNPSLTSNENHWNNLDQQNESICKDKFIDSIANSDYYKKYFPSSTNENK